MGRNKDELIKLAEKITGQECKDVLTKKDALKKIACHYLGEEKEFASIADCLESIVEHGVSGGDTYAHKVEMKFDNFSLTYYGNGELLTSNLKNFQYFANEYPEVTVSGDLSELLNFFPILLSKSANQNEYTKDKKCSYHIYLKDEDTDNLVKGVGITGNTNSNFMQLGIQFNEGNQDKYFTNTVVLEWN